MYVIETPSGLRRTMGAVLVYKSREAAAEEIERCAAPGSDWRIWPARLQVQRYRDLPLPAKVSGPDDMVCDVKVTGWKLEGGVLLRLEQGNGEPWPQWEPLDQVKLIAKGPFPWEVE